MAEIIMDSFEMKLYQSEEVFSRTSLGDEKDHDVFVIISYTCPNCGNELLFREKDFRRHALNKTTKYGDLLPEIEMGLSNSFLEFECPGCKIKTRVYYGVYYGDKFPRTYIDVVMTD